MACKSGTHVGSHGKSQTKTATVMAHLLRIRGNCVFGQDAVGCCLSKLVELESAMCGWKPRDLKRVIMRKISKNELMDNVDSFWMDLLKLYNIKSMC